MRSNRVGLPFLLKNLRAFKRAPGLFGLVDAQELWSFFCFMEGQVSSDIVVQACYTNTTTRSASSYNSLAVRAGPEGHFYISSFIGVYHIHARCGCC